MAYKLDIVGGEYLGPAEGWALEKVDSGPSCPPLGYSNHIYVANVLILIWAKSTLYLAPHRRPWAKRAL